MSRRATLAEFFCRATDFSGKTLREIAREAGFDRPNVMSMMRSGEMKIPLDRIPALARACHVDPVHFLRLALVEYHPEIWEVLVETIGVPLTANEMDMVTCYRVVAPEEEIEMTPEVTKAVIDTLVDFLPHPK